MLDIKNIIREKRLELNLTYEELGNMIGVGKSTVRKWETGMIENIRRDNIVALAKALNISPALIMGWDIKEDENVDVDIQVLKQNELINEFNKLNSIGKEEALKRVAELTEINKYIENTYNETSASKHNITELYVAEKHAEYNFAAHDDRLSPEKAKERIEKAKAIFKQMDEEE